MMTSISEHISFPRGFLGAFKMHILNTILAIASLKICKKQLFFFGGGYLFITVSENIYPFHCRNLRECDFLCYPVLAGDIKYMEYVRYYLSTFGFRSF